MHRFLIVFFSLLLLPITVFPITDAHSLTTKIQLISASESKATVQWSIRGVKSRSLRRSQLEIQSENILTNHFDLAAIIVSPRGRGVVTIPLRHHTSLRAKLVLRSRKPSVSNIVVLSPDEEFNGDDPQIIDPGPNNDPELPKIPYSLEIKDGRTLCDRSVVADTLMLINAFRSSNGLSVLTEEPILSRSSLAHANWMAEKNVMSHEGWFDRFILSGGSLGAVAQNIAMGVRNADQLAQGWLASSSHRENILNPKYSRTGLACVASSNGTYYWSHYFGS